MLGALLLRACVRKVIQQHDSNLCTLRQPLRALQDERKAEDGSVPGFGQLHPRTQGVTTLGTIYSSSLFPERCPPGMFLMLNYIGGATNRGILQQSKEDIVAQARPPLPVPVCPLVLARVDATLGRVESTLEWKRGCRWTRTCARRACH